MILTEACDDPQCVKDFEDMIARLKAYGYSGIPYTIVVCRHIKVMYQQPNPEEE